MWKFLSWRFSNTLAGLEGGLEERHMLSFCNGDVKSKSLDFYQPHLDAIDGEIRHPNRLSSTSLYSHEKRFQELEALGCTMKNLAVSSHLASYPTSITEVTHQSTIALQCWRDSEEVFVRKHAYWRISGMG